jgi:hypothetical protein
MSDRIQTKPRRQSREAYRLWFEFLRRALAENKEQVKIELYESWGDVSSYRSFPAWWREVGVNVINLHSDTVELVAEGKADANSYLLRVPKTLTSTEIGNEVRKYLMTLGHAPKKTTSLRITEGKEIRPQTYRAYLHTYDQHRKLVLAANGKNVTAKDVLIEVRKFYLNRQRRYKNSVRKVDSIPTPLVDGMNLKDLDAAKWLDSTTAINAINRYLKSARKLIASVSNGKFPE